MTRPVSDGVGGADIPNLPLLDDSLEYASIERKPSWRGWIHAATFPIAIATGVILVVVSDGTSATWASAVFMTTSLLLFGISAT